MASRNISSSSVIVQTSKIQVDSQNQNPTAVKTGKHLDTTRENNKNIMRRTRNALGDIGNRLTKGANHNLKAGTGTKSGTTGIGFKVPGSVRPAPPQVPTTGTVSSRNGALFRNNSIVTSNGLSGTGSLQSFSSLKGFGVNLKNVKIKPQPQLLRTQSFHSKVRTKGIPVASGVENASAVSIPPQETARCEPVAIRVTSTADWKVVDAEIVQQKVRLSDVGERDEKEIENLSEAFSLQRFDIPDIDAVDTSSNCVRDYIKDISCYLFKLEKSYPIKEKYLTGRVINGRMRSVLMDWIVEVHSQFGYCAETLYMTAKTLDRYLQVESTVTRTQLQLVGMTSMYLSAKFEEVMTPNINDFASISDSAFSIEDLRQMEERMLKVLKFDLAPPQPVFFLRRCSKAAQAQVNLHQFAKYIMEISLVDYDAIHLYPSQIAAGAFGVASMVIENKSPTAIWTATLEHYAGYTLKELRPILKLLTVMLARVYEDQSKYQAVANKYARARALRISRIPQVQSIGSWKPRILQELENLK